jgi:ADP-ribose pyrophosphatase YjhB (NUDIX family)
MRIFINDISVKFAKSKKKFDLDNFNTIIDASQEKITRNKLINHVLIQDISLDDIDSLLKMLDIHAFRNLQSLTIQTNEYDMLRPRLKEEYKTIKAAGGLVRKGDKILMIYRLKKWDLPKGKLEKGESAAAGALREVEEECGVKVTLGEKICTSKHTYNMKEKNILKKTTWYVMDCVSDKKMTPQTEEDIEEVRWMNAKEVYVALQNTYRSIAHVFEKYEQLK